MALIQWCEVENYPLEALAEYISRVRAQKKLSLPEIKRRGGPSFAWVNSVENRLCFDSPKPVTLRKLAKGLGVPESEVFAAAGLILPGTLLDQTIIGITSESVKPANHDGVMISGDQGKDPRQKLSMASGVTGKGESVSRSLHSPNHVVLPLYGPVAAGNAITFSMSDAPDTITLTHWETEGADAAFRVSGDCLSHYGIRSGSLLIAAKFNGNRPADGDVVIVEAEGEYFAKVYRKNALGEYLESHEAGKAPEPHTYPDGTQIVALVLRGIVKFR